MSGLPESALLVLREWIQNADNDWKVSEYLLTMGQDCPYEVVCFHVQQSVEKYVKAFERESASKVPEQAKLKDYATVDRYPGDREPITRAEAEEAV